MPSHNHAPTIIQQIKNWQKQGDSIVLLVNANGILEKTGPLQPILSHECQLIDLIREIYHTPGIPLLSTSLTRSEPIDRIFVLPELRRVTRGRWLKLEEFLVTIRSSF